MALADFTCPHCNRRFQMEHPPGAPVVPCPDCGQPFSPAAPAPPEPPPAIRATAPSVHYVSREQRYRRRQIRSAVLMVGGFLLLALAAIVFARL